MFVKIFSSLKRKKEPSKPTHATLDLDVLESGLAEIERKEKEARAILDVLEIPYHPEYVSTNSKSAVYVTDLVKILKDEKRLKTISAKMRNKAFW
jgi:hypothetical protein